MHLVSWIHLAKPKVMGDWGIKQLYSFMESVVEGKIFEKNHYCRLVQKKEVANTL